MIRRKKTTIFTDAKDNTTVLELKKMIEGKFSINKFIYYYYYQCSYLFFGWKKKMRGPLEKKIQ